MVPFLLIVFFESAAVALVASFQPSTPSGCKAQFGIIALTVFTFGIMYATKAPYRHTLDNALSVLTCCALMVMALTAAISGPEDPHVRDAYMAALSLGILAGCARCVLTSWRSFAEYRHVAAVPLPRGERRVRLVEDAHCSDASIGEIPLVDSDGSSAGD